jgi:uncharacterized protein (DUF305 family)
MYRYARTHALAALALTGVLTLAGCSDDDPGSMPGMDHGSPSAATRSASPVGDHNDADVAFATGMIPHHQQAVQMAEMAIRKATTPAVKQLATAVKTAQGPEIRQMSGWLTSWESPFPAPVTAATTCRCPA